MTQTPKPKQDPAIDEKSANATQTDSKAHGGSVSAPPLIQDGVAAPVAASQVSPGTLNAPAPAKMRKISANR